MIIGVALALAAALVLGAASAAVVLAVATGLVQAAVVARWHRALQVPGAREGVVVAGAAALGADLLVLTADEAHPMGPAAAVGGVAVVASLAAQLVRRDGRPGLTESLAATITLAALTVLGAGYLAAATADQGDLQVAAAAVSAGIVAAAGGRTGRSVLGWVLGGLLAVAAGVAVLVVGDAPVRTVAAVPVGVTAVAALGRLVAERLPRPDPYLAAALPLLLAGPAVLVIGRVLTS